MTAASTALHERVVDAARTVADLNTEGRSSYGRVVTHAEFQHALFDLESAVLAYDKAMERAT